MTKHYYNPLEDSNCVACDAPIYGGKEAFKDDLSMREYMLSGLCQKCQDSVFGTDISEWEMPTDAETYYRNVQDGITSLSKL